MSFFVISQGQLGVTGFSHRIQAFPFFGWLVILRYLEYKLLNIEICGSNLEVQLGHKTISNMNTNKDTDNG